jgi:F0F1-type ATP synthase delta subunit
MNITRRRLATYIADGLETERESRLRQVAAWLIEQHRTNEASYVVRDIQSVMAYRGVVSATITTSRPLSTGTRHGLKDFIRRATSATKLEVQEKVNSKLLGGAMIETPDARFDGTVTTKLHTLVTEMTQ